MDATLRAVVVGAALLLVACALRLASDRLSAATGIGPGWCLALVVLALLLAFALFGWWRGGVIAAQATDLGDQFGTRAQGFWVRLGQTDWGARLANQARDAVESSLASVGGNVTGFTRSTLGIGDTVLLVAVAGLFAAVQTLGDNVIAPLIQRRTVSLPPALTLFSQTVLGTLFGPLGLILATPVMAATLVAVRMAYVESVLERPDGDDA